MKSTFLETAQERVLVLDGAIGTNIHSRDLPLSDYRGLENCLEVLNLTRPDVIHELHSSFLDVGCDGVTTNSFGGASLILQEFGLEGECLEINRQAASIARKACDEYSTPDRPRFVIGSMGPGTKLVSLGQATWDELLKSYTLCAQGLLDGGADIINVETCQDILQSKVGIVAAMDAMQIVGRDVPISCSVTIETTGTMLLGTEIAAAVTAIDPYCQVQVVGLNCATGPQQMSEFVRYLSGWCNRLLLVQPNAGLPQLVDGNPYYALGPDELAKWLAEFVDVDGVNIVGGCCGTTPMHLKAVAQKIGQRKPKDRQVKGEASASSIYQSVALRQEKAILAIGERTNANGSKKFRELLAAQDYDAMVQMGKEQVKAGSHLLDVCAAYVGRDEIKDMTEIIHRFATEITVPIVIDSTEVPVIEAALKLLGGKCIINSINLEDGEERLDQVCVLAKRHGAAVIALTIDEEGMAKTADRKLAIARRIHDRVTEKHGIDPQNLLFDPLTFTVCTGVLDDRRLALETLEGIALIKQELPGVHTLLGVSNVSFGLKPPARKVLNSVFMHYAQKAGLDSAIMHAGGIVPLFKIEDAQRTAAEDLIHDRSTNDYSPLEHFIELFPQDAHSAPESRPLAKSVEERLKHRIIDGNRVGLEDDLDEAMTTYPPLSIVNDILLDSMKTVGDLFGAGQMQLPFVLKSAETMKAAVSFLEPFMDRVEGESKGKIVLATVRGDVHDIGKNLVDIILTNNGYTVYNLGIKQPINVILEAFEEHQADTIGMSGLLVKSTVVMRENLAVMVERDITPPVILGGAALTRKYVEKDLRPEYTGSLQYAKDAFAGLRLMDDIMSGAAAPVGVAKLPVSASVAEDSPPKLPVEPSRPEARPAQSDISREEPIPVPPFWGARVVEEIPLREVLVYMNENMLFQVQWQYRRAGRPLEEFERYVHDTVRPTYRDLVARCESEQILQPKAIYGYWPVQAEGDTLVVYDSPDLVDGVLPNGDDGLTLDRCRKVARFEFPRQRKAPYWCLSDFFRSVDSGAFDVAAFSVVTVGRRASDVAREWFEQDRYTDYLHLHGLGVESAEALAEYIHKQVRAELGIADGDDRNLQGIFKQHYQGSRYSFGYPACPRLEDQVKLWPLLRPGRIGVALSSEFQLEPEQTTTAIICHHSDAKYFNVR